MNGKEEGITKTPSTTVVHIDGKYVRVTTHHKVRSDVGENNKDTD